MTSKTFRSLSLALAFGLASGSVSANPAAQEFLERIGAFGAELLSKGTASQALRQFVKHDDKSIRAFHRLTREARKHADWSRGATAIDGTPNRALIVLGLLEGSTLAAAKSMRDDLAKNYGLLASLKPEVTRIRLRLGQLYPDNGAGRAKLAKQKELGETRRLNSIVFSSAPEKAKTLNGVFSRLLTQQISETGKFPDLIAFHDYVRNHADVLRQVGTLEEKSLDHIIMNWHYNAELDPIGRLHFFELASKKVEGKTSELFSNAQALLTNSHATKAYEELALDPEAPVASDQPDA